MSGKEGGERPKVTRGLQVTEVVIGRRDGGRGEAERAAALGREEELEEEGGEMERGADSWVESTERESGEGGKAKDIWRAGVTGTRQGGPRPSRWHWCYAADER
jgi:hypothetical protein